MANVKINNRGLALFQKSFYERRTTQTWIFVLLAVTPPYLGYWLFNLYPNILSVYYSLLNWDGITTPTFVGLDNFITLFKDDYVWRAFSHNLFLMMTVTPLVIIISIVLSYLITHKKYKGSGLFKVLFFFPNILSTVVVALLWAFIYDGSYGLLNGVIRMFGIDIGNYYWLGQSSTALAAIVPPSVWGAVGLYIVIFSNAMSTIPKSLYEAAILEGASHFQRMRMITVPLINPIVRFSILFIVLGEIKGFEQVLILTNGGPAGSTDVISLYMFNLAFGDEYRNFGYASSIGMILFTLLLTVKLLVDRYMPNKGTEY